MEGHDLSGHYLRPMVEESDAVAKSVRAGRWLVRSFYGNLVTDFGYLAYEVAGLWVDLSTDDVVFLILGIPWLLTVLSSLVFFSIWMARSLRALLLLKGNGTSLSPSISYLALILPIPTIPILVHHLALRVATEEERASMAALAASWWAPLIVAATMTGWTLHPRYEEVYSGPIYHEYLFIEGFIFLASAIAAWRGIRTVRTISRIFGERLATSTRSST